MNIIIHVFLLCILYYVYVYYSPLRYNITHIIVKIITPLVINDREYAIKVAVHFDFILI